MALLLTDPWQTNQGRLPSLAIRALDAPRNNYDLRIEVDVSSQICKNILQIEYDVYNTKKWMKWRNLARPRHTGKTTKNSLRDLIGPNLGLDCVRLWPHNDISVSEDPLQS